MTARIKTYLLVEIDTPTDPLAQVRVDVTELAPEVGADLAADQVSGAWTFGRAYSPPVAAAAAIEEHLRPTVAERLDGAA